MSTPLSPILSARERRRKQYEVVDKFFNKMQRQAMVINAHDEYIADGLDSSPLGHGP